MSSNERDTNDEYSPVVAPCVTGRAASAAAAAVVNDTMAID